MGRRRKKTSENESKIRDKTSLKLVQARTARKNNNEKSRLNPYTVVENLPKSRIQNCERSELHLHLGGHKFIRNAKNGQFWRVFECLNVERCYQTGQF